LTTRFETDTAVRALAPGLFETRIDRGWWIRVGPNGGYVAAILLRALTAELAVATRAPRSLTVHYTEPAAEGPARVHACVERAGRAVSTLSARLEQDGRTRALALATFAEPRAGLEFCDRRMPEAPPPERVLPRGLESGPSVSPLRERLEARPLFGERVGHPSGEALVGGWMRPVEPQLLDPPLLALLCDAWPPAVFTRLRERRGTPTLDLTVHFRAPLPASARPDDFYLVVFRATTATQGFVEEDGEVWTRDGYLLAHSRQLAMFA
jgi:acyl-CoA thioesterase